jgi:serine/threonine protein kinase/Flp pilus assembly protein TadD
VVGSEHTTRECGPGGTLGHYQVLEKIGAGGMGEVFRARDQHLDRDVAIKVLPPGTLGDDSARKRFHKEALALSKLNHPNIATIHDFDTQQGVDFLVMEYIPGVTLSEKLAKGPLPEKDVINLGTQLAEGLSAAHEHGVVHRDLKPGNLRLTTDGRLKILDFGLARLRLPVTPTAPTASFSETQVMAGTLPYMAPEQLLGEETDARTDIHAAGAVLYEMATGQQPFAQVERAQLIGAILHRRPRPAASLNPRLSPELERIIEKCLEKGPGNRYQSAKELAVDLRRLARDKEAQGIAQEAPAVSRLAVVASRKVMLATAAGIVILLLGAIFLPARMKRRFESARTSPAMAASIAVLPFADLSPGHDHEYLSEGLAEEILNNLTKIPNLRVTARTSAFQFKGKNEDSRVIGQKLDVADILEGSVQSEGNRVRITVRLTKADVGLSLWSESYDRELKDVFAVEDDIATAVSSALQPRLLGRQSTATPPPSRSTSPEAYETFLQARAFFRTADTRLEPRAFDYLNRAIQLDPNYAPAYALRSVMTAESGLMGRRDLPAALANSRHDAEKAVELDPKLAAGYRALSETQAMADWDWQAAERSARRARELAPGDADVLGQCAYLAMSQGRIDEAIDLTRQGLELDPLQPGSYVLLGQILRDLGRYEAAHASFQRALELGPNQVWTHEMNGEVYLAQNRLAEALAEMEKEPEGFWRDFGEALAYHALGRRQDSDAALARLITEGQNVAAFQIAQVYAYKGETDQAFAWLDRACRQRDGGLGHLKADWLLKSLRKDPRYAQLLRRVNLPE